MQTAIRVMIDTFGSTMRAHFVSDDVNISSGLCNGQGTRDACGEFQSQRKVG